MIDIKNINEQIHQILSEKIENELQTENLHKKIVQAIDQITQEKVDATVNSVLNQMIDQQKFDTKIDHHLNHEINEKISQAVNNRVIETANRTDIATKIGESISAIVESRLDRAALPEKLIPWKTINWGKFRLSADAISPGTIKKFNSVGIQDIASDVNLTVSDDQVIIEGETVSKYLTVVDSATVKTLTVDGDITVKGRVNFYNKEFSDQIIGLVDNRIAESSKNLDLNGDPLLSNGNALITENSLGKSIANSNLRSVGRLKSLSVSGETDLSETVYTGHGRTGFNTDEPDGVITAWDEEAELTIKKYRNRTMYVGSTRGCNLVLGVNNNNSVTVTERGVETNSVKIGNITISADKKQPDHRGSPGDIVFNERAEKGQPWAWRCTGGTVWVGLYQ